MNLPEPVAWLVTWQGEKHEYAQTFASETTAIDKAMMMCGRCEPLARVAHLEAAVAAAVAQERERNMIALREWAVSRWRAEVQHRPLVNKNRRSLDDSWRQVMKYAGLDPDDAVGPSHDALLQSGFGVKDAIRATPTEPKP